MSSLYNEWEYFLDEGYFHMWCVRPKGSRKFGEGFHVSSEAEAARLAKALTNTWKDYPEWDGTDGAHPAWWRGHDYTAEHFCKKVNAILDGEDSGKGFNREPWGSLRQRLLRLREYEEHKDDFDI